MTIEKNVSALLCRFIAVLRALTVHLLSLLVIPHFAQNVEYSVNTLAKDPHGDVDEAQFIDASKLVRKNLSKFKPLKCP